MEPKITCTEWYQGFPDRNLQFLYSLKEHNILGKSQIF
jgi:hypothetical protein